jgi:hypothetical protein
MLQKTVAYLIYLIGVVFFSWNYQTLKSALGTFSLFVFSGFFLLGVSQFATFVSTKIHSKVK